MKSVLARQWVGAVALAPIMAVALAAAPAEAGVTASLVSNQIIVTSNVPGKNYSSLNGLSSVDVSKSESPDQGFSVNALSDLTSNEILFKNGSAAVGFGTTVEVVTGVAVTFTNDQNVAVTPVLQSTLLAAGLGIFLTPQVESGSYGNILGSANCTSGQVANCGEPNAAQAASLRRAGTTISSYGSSSSGFDFNVSVDGSSIYNLAGSVGVNSNGLYSNLGAAAATLSGFSKTSANGDHYALGYDWGNTPVDITLPELQAGQSVTAIYSITTYVSMAANGGCTVVIYYGATCEAAYSSFGDPVGRGGGIPNATPTFTGLALGGFSPNLFGPGDQLINIDTGAEGVFNLLTPVYDPTTHQYIAELPATVLFPGGVPEPATWALMLSGIGLLGGALRSRRGATA